MSTNETFYCPFCGSQQSKGQEFCGSCGASLKSVAPSSDIGSKTEQIIPPPVQQGYIPPPGQQGYIPPPGQQPYTYGAPAQTTYVASQQPKKDNANIALILGIVSFFIGGIVTAIIGLVYVKKAVENNEDRQTTQNAKVLCWIAIGLSIAGIILSIVFGILSGFSWFYWW
ncbi:MAG TPA: hypothetical protein VMZ29_01005 [Candidatus Bathyarchaeia archaeon]|nr:hypothetical protein [Candidatus Bathyarchaeia archaeon]